MVESTLLVDWMIEFINSEIYRVSLKKGTFAIFVLFLFQKLDFAFSHMFWNHNFEPGSSSHSNYFHSESNLP